MLLDRLGRKTREQEDEASAEIRGEVSEVAIGRGRVERPDKNPLRSTIPEFCLQRLSGLLDESLDFRRLAGPGVLDREIPSDEDAAARVPDGVGSRGPDPVILLPEPLCRDSTDGREDFG